MSAREIAMSARNCVPTLLARSHVLAGMNSSWLQMARPAKVTVTVQLVSLHLLPPANLSGPVVELPTGSPHELLIGATKAILSNVSNDEVSMYTESLCFTFS